MKHARVCSYAAVLAVASLFFFSPLAPAQGAGYDLLQTGPGASINLSSIPGFSPSAIDLHGVPICECTGAADTIMYRTAVGAGGRANLTVIALFLKNSGPVTFGGTPVDVYITINNSSGMIGKDTVPQADTLTPSTGILTIHPGGTFDSNFTVKADVIAVAVGADVRNPATPLVVHHRAPWVHLGATGAPWSATPPPGYPKCFFPGNGFYPAGPVPEHDPTTPAHRHPVVPSSPYSATVVAVPPSYTGSCAAGVVFNFEGTITSTVAGDITYTWIRSDGAISPTVPLHFATPGSQHVHDEWHFATPGQNFDGSWEAVKILTPGVLESNHATISLHCAP